MALSRYHEGVTRKASKPVKPFRDDCKLSFVTYERTAVNGAALQGPRLSWGAVPTNMYMGWLEYSKAARAARANRITLVRVLFALRVQLLP